MIVRVGRLARLQPAGDDVEHPALDARGHLLRQIGHAQILLTGHDSALRQDIAVHQLEQRGLAHAVAAQQAHPLARLDL
jgi:hypothetical protein